MTAARPAVDPFAGLLEEEHAGPGDVPPGAAPEREARSEEEGDALATLFGAEPRRTRARSRHDARSGWPDHNYGPAYWGVRRRVPRRAPSARDTQRVWEVDELLEAPPDEEESGPPVPPDPAPLQAWAPATRLPLDTAPDRWLTTLATKTPLHRTAARLVGVAAGDPITRYDVVLEMEEVVRSRPRADTARARSSPIARLVARMRRGGRQDRR